LFIASQYGHVEVARLLVDSGADIDNAAKDGGTALGAARHFGHEAIVKLLLAAGARG
jgi:ankyrin repeat protein